MKTFRLVFNVFFVCIFTATLAYTFYPMIMNMFVWGSYERSFFEKSLTYALNAVIVGPFLVAEVETWYDLHYLIFAKKRTVGQIIFNIFMLLCSLTYITFWVVTILNISSFDDYFILFSIPILYLFAARYIYFAISKARDNVKAKSNSTISEEIDL